MGDLTLYPTNGALHHSAIQPTYKYVYIRNSSIIRCSGESSYLTAFKSCDRCYVYEMVIHFQKRYAKKLIQAASICWWNCRKRYRQAISSMYSFFVYLFDILIRVRYIGFILLKVIIKRPSSSEVSCFFDKFSLIFLDYAHYLQPKRYALRFTFLISSLTAYEWWWVCDTFWYVLMTAFIFKTHLLCLRLAQKNKKKEPSILLMQSVIWKYIFWIIHVDIAYFVRFIYLFAWSLNFTLEHTK